MAIITAEACVKHNIPIAQAIALLALGCTNEDDYKELAERNLIDIFHFMDPMPLKKYRISREGKLFLEELLSDSKEEVVKKGDDKFMTLAEQLRAIYPAGKMPGTNYYYRCNKADVARKLKSFCRRYGMYSDEEIIDATQRYVDSFNGCYTYMRLLKYFIWKDEVKDGETIANSELANWIENADDNSNEGWTTVL